MATETVVDSCNCVTFDTVEAIRFCKEHHRYFYGKRQLTSFSRMLETVYPIKREELEAVKLARPGLIEHAAERGSRVNAYADQYVLMGSVELPTGEWQDVADRVECFVNWFDKAKPEVLGVQQIVYDLEDGVAATKDYDLRFDGTTGTSVICDMKCTANPDWTWKLQLGCHQVYTLRGLPVMVLHINPDKYAKIGGVKLLSYDWHECMTMFDAARQWWRQIQKAKGSDQ